MILKAEFDDLVEKADKLKLGRKAYGARWPDFKPKANTLNKQFFLKEGDYTEKKLAKMMEGFVKAGGKEEHVVHVKHAFEEMLQSNQNVQMQIDALADVCVQYSQLG